MGLMVEGWYWGVKHITIHNNNWVSTLYPLQRKHSSYYEIVVIAPKPLDLTWVLEIVFYLDYCTILLMVCGLSNFFSFYVRINLSIVVCYMHGMFDKMP